MNICTEKFTVTLPDVGENNELTNKGFLRMLQEIACIHSKKAGYGVSDAVETGHAWIILNWKLKVFSRPKWNETLTINTWSSEHSFISYYRDFEVFDDKNNLVAIATSKWVFYDLNNNTFVKFSDDSGNQFELVNKKVFETPMKEKLVEPENSTFVANYKITRRDIDTNHHVNNLSYIDFAYEILPEDVFRNCDFKNIEIMYKHEAKLGDTLNLYYAKQDNSFVVTIKSEDNKRIHCIIRRNSDKQQ